MGAGDLIDLALIEGLFEDQQPIRALKFFGNFLPGIGGVGTADDDVEIRIDFPELADRLDAIPAGRHLHVHKSEVIGITRVDRGADFFVSVCSLERRVDLEFDLPRRSARLSKQCQLVIDQSDGTGAALQDRAEIVVDRLVVVDHDHAAGLIEHGVVHLFTGVRDGVSPLFGAASRLMGRRRVNVAPRPGPSLAAVRSPPISLAALAALCRPKP